MKKQSVVFNRQRNVNLFVLLGIVAVLIVFIALMNEKFLSAKNISSVLIRTCEDCIIASSMTLVIIAGSIDLSVGTIMALTPCVLGVLYGAGMPFGLAVLIGIASGLVVGALNSYLIAYARIPAFIATLATMTGTRSAVYVISQGSTITTFPESIGLLAGKSPIFVPYPVLIMAAVVALAWLLLNKTKYGRFIYAIGGNETAAFASGIKVARIKTAVMMTSALCGSLAGLMLTSRVTTTGPNVGSQAALNAITAVLIGGASINGGKGRLSQSIIGVAIMALIDNGLNMLRISSYWQLIITGAVLIAIVGMDNVRRERKTDRAVRAKA